MSGPSKRLLDGVERELRKRPRGSQRAVGDGIYMRLDADGRRRFQFRLRSGTAQPGATYDSFDEALAERRNALTELESRRELGLTGPLTSDLRRMKLRDYARDHWWKSVEVDLDSLTQLSYRRHLKAQVLPLIGDVTLAQLESAPLVVDEFKNRLVALLTYPDDHPRAGQLPRSTADHALTVASSICAHAVNRGIISRNPFIGIVRFGQQRTPETKGGRSNYRRAKPSEVMHPRTVAQAGAGMTGTWRQVEERRAVIDLLGFGGLRPSDICAARHDWWRDENGAKRFMTVDEAIKDVAGHLEPGEPKTGTRDIYLFDAIAWQLERVYQAQGCPPLDHLVAPNTFGGFQDWGNWRTNYWYQALHRSGLAAAPTSGAPGAFDPYLLRHILAGTMSHAVRPARWGGGTYSRAEVARQLGHSVGTLDRVYADIPHDLHGIAGMTMDEIIRAARRSIWGALPGDDDFEDELLSVLDAALLSGIPRNNLYARIQRGSLPNRGEGSHKLVSRFDLRWCGLIDRCRGPVDSEDNSDRGGEPVIVNGNSWD